MNKIERKQYIMNCVQEHYEEACSLGYEVVGVWLQGSQNYDLDCYDENYMSDIDTKCIVLPTLHEIVAGKAPRSHVHVRKNNEHIDIKDIRVMFEMFKKQNIAYLEILFTDFFVINPKYEKLVAELKDRAEEIAHISPNLVLKCSAGMSLEKYRALEHPYPTALEKIEKFGYDPKQLHHILRINYFLKKYVGGYDFKICLMPTNSEQQQHLLAIKRGECDLNEARQLALECDIANKALKDCNINEDELVDTHTIQFLDDLKEQFIRQFLIEELKKDN